MDVNQITELVKKAMANLESTPEVKASSSSFKAEDRVTLHMARELSRQVIEEAAKIGVKAVCAVADAGARPILVECTDDSYIASYDIAVNKAFTSVSLKMKTSVLAELAQPNAPLYGIQHTNEGKIVIFGGGIPLIKNGKIIGGFGVSGGSAEQDTYLGDYAEKVFNKISDK